MQYLFTGAAVAILLLTTCGPAATPETVPTPPPVTPTTTPAQTTFDSPLPRTTPLPPTAKPPTPVEPEDTGRGRAAMGDAVIIYQRSGGFAGIHEQWTVYPDGRIVAANGQVHQVTPAQVSKLLGRIETLGFFDMEDEYLPEDTCCDRLTHTLTLRRNNQTKTVTTLDATPNAPAALWGAIDIVARLVFYQR